MHPPRARARTSGLAAILLIAACTGSPESATDGLVARGGPGSGGSPAVVSMPPVAEPFSSAPGTGPGPATAATSAPTDTFDRAPHVAVIDTDGQLGLVVNGVVRNDWFKFDAFPSPDRSTAVLTLGPEIGIGPERPIVWVSLPNGDRLAEQTMRTASELTATSLDGAFAGFTTRADDPAPGTIAGARSTSEIEVISRDHGTVFRQTLDGNFVPEAFGRSTNATGVPALVFLLEYFPAEAPRFYRVRVLSTGNGEVSLPLNLRDKSQQVDERMAGFSRSQVVAEDDGLLFTLYRGTIDGTPEGERYAFVHTLDLADGVWCLEVDPRLELERLPGSLAVGGDRLYVASANGFVGAYPIPSISDPNLSPSMSWVVDTGVQADAAPVITADAEAVYVADPARPGFLAHIHQAGLLHPAVSVFDAEPTALAWKDGALHAVGDDWATFEIGRRPEWLDEIAYLVLE
jgi:hypothetical protein